MTVRFIAYGGSVVSIEVPDRHGTLRDVVLGYDSLDGYASDRRYLGALIGRYANRIARGRFTLDGRVHTLTINDGPNHLHGGRRGFHKVPWEVTPVEDGATTGALLTYTSVTGDEGYPGTMSVSVIITLTPDNALIFDYAAVADEPTPVNLTHERESRELERRMPEIRHPHLVVWGEGDGWIAPADLRTMAAAMPDCRLVVVPGIGHSMNLEVPALYAGYFGAWFGGLLK